MTTSRRTSRTASAVVVLVLAVTGLVSWAPASRAAVSPRDPGTTSLATALAADGHHLDHDWRDVDVYDKFLHRTLTLRPHNPLSLLTRGDRYLTAFVPTDGAYRRLERDFFGHRVRTEGRLFHLLWAQSGDNRHQRVRTIIDFLSYGVIEDEAFTAQRLRHVAPAAVLSLQGGVLRIRVRHGDLLVLDRESASPPARVLPSLRNINDGNRQLAQGVSALLSPAGQ